MKQLTTNLLKFTFKGIDLSKVSKIEFAFSQGIGTSPLKVETYPSDKVISVSDNTLGVAWSTADTALFKAGEYFYADTRITMTDSEYQPETAILKLRMNPTLFEKA